MSPINPMRKGANAEREIASHLNNFKLPGGDPVVAKRGCQHAGGVDTPDVKHNIPNVHLEIKRCEKMSPSKARESLLQSARDAGSNLPVVVWRSNRTEWCCILTLDHMLALLGCNRCDSDNEERDK